MFTKNLRFFGQILDPQWLAQTSKMGQKNGLYLSGVNNRHLINYGQKSPKTIFKVYQ
jgi:hypothetical protein